MRNYDCKDWQLGLATTRTVHLPQLNLGPALALGAIPRMVFLSSRRLLPSFFRRSLTASMRLTCGERTLPLPPSPAQGHPANHKPVAAV